MSPTSSTEQKTWEKMTCKIYQCLRLSAMIPLCSSSSSWCVSFGLVISCKQIELKPKSIENLKLIDFDCLNRKRHSYHHIKNITLSPFKTWEKLISNFGKWNPYSFNSAIAFSQQIPVLFIKEVIDLFFQMSQPKIHQSMLYSPRI